MTMTVPAERWTSSCGTPRRDSAVDLRGRPGAAARENPAAQVTRVDGDAGVDPGSMRQAQKLSPSDTPRRSEWTCPTTRTSRSRGSAEP